MPHSTDGRISILMPAYQLEDTIGPNIDRVAAVVDDWADVEVIVIDDGSTDATRQNAAVAAADHPTVTVIGYAPNRGKGGAIRAGFEESTGDTIVFLDSDLDLPPEQLADFLATMDESGVDALVGAKRASMTAGHYPSSRKILSRIFALVNRVLFRLPVEETQTGLKAFRRTALETTLPNLQILRYAFDLELLVRVHKAGFTIAEGPVTLSENSSSGLSITTLWEMGRDTIRIWYRSLSWR